MIRVMLGDTVEIRMKNDKNSKESHNIDFHAITGPGGGASLLNSEPGQESGGRFKMIIPGVFMYHCATASPSIPEHVANGMYGTIVVEPAGGLKPVDREYQITQSEFYTKEGGKGETLEFSFENGLDERPSHVVYNGHATRWSRIPSSQGRGNRSDFLYQRRTQLCRLVSDPRKTVRQGVHRGFFDYTTDGKCQDDQGSDRWRGVVEFKVKAPGTYTFVDE